MNSIDHRFYLNAQTQAEDLEKLATLSISLFNDVVLNAAVHGLSDCFLHNALRGHPGDHITSTVMERLVRITKLRLDSPLGLDMNKVTYSVGPFVSVTERSSLAAVNIQLVNSIAELSRAGNWDLLNRLRSSYEEIHDRLWLWLAELGIGAIRKGSFLMFYINSSLEEIVRANVWLLQAPRLPRIEEVDWESAREQHARDSFPEKIRKIISRETTGVYSRIIPAMFEHKKLDYLDETIEQQCLFAFWSIDVGMAEVATGACQRIFTASTQLREGTPISDPYRSARLSAHVADIGIYALAKGAGDVLSLAVERYRELRARFDERYPDLRFAGDFESAESDLMENRSGMVFETHDQTFFSVVTDEHIQEFFQLVADSRGN